MNLTPSTPAVDAKSEPKSDPITHGFGLDDTEDGVWRRMAIGRTASGRYDIKLEMRGPQDDKARVMRFSLTPRGFLMLAKLVDEAEHSMYRHPVKEGFRDF